jgi:hypothetical protein
VTGSSIYSVIRSHLDEAGRLTDPDLSLPDEPDVSASGLQWAPGAMDGVLGHHAGTGDSADTRADEAAEAFVRACERPTRKRLRRLYDAVRGDGVLGYLDATIERLVQRQPDREQLHDLGRWLATTASDRGAVKVGIAILGVTGLDRDVDVVRVLGAHDEFTLYAAVALTNGLEHPDSELWALASAVDGWGRIHCVEALRHTRDPAIRSWILRTGFRNSVMYEYLAYIAATTGGLLDALRAGAPDRELLTAAGEIFEALVTGGPAEDLHDYADGPAAVEAYLDVMVERAETLGDFHAVAALWSFLSTEEDWAPTRRTTLLARCGQILGRAEWDDRIATGLLEDDRALFWRAKEAARLRGIDTFDVLVGRIARDPWDGSWFDAWRLADRARAEQLAELARRSFPLDEIASGPAGELGLGPAWRHHQALDWTLAALRNHPGVGGDLLMVGLRSPLIRNRNMALQALQAWPSSQWPSGVRELVAQLAASDPNDHTRELAAEVVGAGG